MAAGLKFYAPPKPYKGLMMMSKVYSKKKITKQ